MPAASSSGSSSGCTGVSGPGAMPSAASAMRPALLGLDLVRAEHSFAPHQYLRGDGGSNCGWRLVLDRGQPDRTDQLFDDVRLHAHLLHRRSEARALGGAPDQADVVEAPRLYRRDDEIEIKRMA